MSSQGSPIGEPDLGDPAALAEGSRAPGGEAAALGGEMADGRSHAAAYHGRADIPADEVQYGPDIATEAQLRLLGPPAGKRILELGCGGAQASVVLAKQGATAIAVDTSADNLAFARQLASQEGVRIELRHGDLAELAFLNAESIDVAFSAYAFSFVEDLRRLFRQVHRVLKVGAPLVFSLPHPCYDLVDDSGPDDRPVVRRSYFERAPIEYEWRGMSYIEHRHTTQDLFGALVRSGYRVDTLLEPEARSAGPRSIHWRDAYRLLPRTLVLRARKEGP